MFCSLKLILNHSLEISIQNVKFVSINLVLFVLCMNFVPNLRLIGIL